MCYTSLFTFTVLKMSNVLCETFMPERNIFNIICSLCISIVWNFLYSMKWIPYERIRISCSLELCSPKESCLQEFVFLVMFEMCIAKEQRSSMALPVLSSKGTVQDMSGLPWHCLYWIRQAHDPEHMILSHWQLHHDCAGWWDRFWYSTRSIT